MSKEYPDWLDPRKAAEGRRRFAGTMQLEKMARLQPLLAEYTGADYGLAEFQADFEFDPQAWVIIRLSVRAELALICQLSLEPYLETVERQSVLCAISDIADEQQLPDSYEPVMLENGRLALLDLVEDELLLGLPQVPRNPGVDSSQFEVGESEKLVVETPSEPVRQPFANLAEQLRVHARDQKKGR